MGLLPFLFWFLLVFKVECAESVNNVTESPSTNVTNDIPSSQKFDHFWHSIGRIMNASDGEFLLVAERIAQISIQLNRSSLPCYRVIEKAFRTGFRQQWSASMINANAFSPGGFVNSLIAEQYTSLGDFNGCTSQEGVSLQTDGGLVHFSGKYCLVSLTTPKMDYYSRAVQSTKFNRDTFFEEQARKWLILRNRFPLALGLCAPSICLQTELVELIGRYFEPYLDGVNLEIGYCQAAIEPKTHRIGFIMALSVLVFVVLTSFLATFLSKFIAFLQTSTAKVHPVASSSVKSKIHWPLVVQFINCFDIEHNLHCLFKADTKVQLQRHVFDLRFAHGLKAFIILGLVYLHTTSFVVLLFFSKLSVFTRLPSFLGSSPDLFSTALIRSFALVDILFIISGFLVTFTVLSKAKKLPNFLSYVFIRYLRLLPPVVAVLCLTIVLQKIGQGPMFHEKLTSPFVEPCYTFWWTHLLLIHNFFTLDQMCGSSLWFIAVEWQLHVLLYAVLFLFYRRKVLAYLFSVLAIVVSIWLYFLYHYLDLPGWPRLDFALRFHAPAPWESIRLFYTSPQGHIFAYLFGAILAMRLLKMGKAPDSSALRDSLLSVFLVVVFILYLYPLQLFDINLNEETSLLFLFWFAVLFVAVMLCQGFLIYYLIMSRDSMIKRFLSSKFLIPIGRLSYGIFLVCPLINWFDTLQNYDPQTLNTKVLVTTFASNYLQCFVLAIFLYVFFQSPIYNVSQLLMAGMDNQQAGKCAHLKSQLALDSSSSHLVRLPTKVPSRKSSQLLDTVHL